MLSNRERGIGSLGGRGVFVDFDALALKSGEQLIDIFRGVFLEGKKLDHFVVKQIAALFAEID